MGLVYHVVEGLIREHAYRAITGDVVLIGRQGVYLTPQEILVFLREHGVDVADINQDDIEIDRRTVHRPAAFASRDLISDAALFRMLGVQNVRALDHSDYEGAEIIHDLTQPVPPALRNCADFIVDGSTLDNIFDPVMVIQNLVEMLRPGGRLITANVFGNHHEPYVILPPLWFLDYFVANGFADCKVYILVLPTGVAPGTYLASLECMINTDVFTIDLDALLDPTRQVSAFSSPRAMLTIVFAEKGAGSTSDISPSQQHYRSESEWTRYRENLLRIRLNPRPHLVRSRGPITLTDVKAGHLFMADDFVARDPLSEIRRLATKAPTGSAREAST